MVFIVTTQQGRSIGKNQMAVGPHLIMYRCGNPYGINDRYGAIPTNIIWVRMLVMTDAVGHFQDVILKDHLFYFFIGIDRVC